jgi:outer membrane protein OmpA-like peptidoglycan-associated protein
MFRTSKIFAGVMLCFVFHAAFSINVFAATHNAGAITFKWSDDEPIVGRDFARFKTTELAKLQNNAALEIIGLYSAAEQQAAGNPSPNLGLTRATKAAALWVSSIPSNRIRLSSALVADDGFTEVTKKMAPFAAVSLDKVPMKSARENSAWSAKPAPVLFPINKVIRHPNPVVGSYLKKVASILKSSGRRAILVGFADRRGRTGTNLRLATQRAELIRAELTQLGVSPRQIDISTSNVVAPDPQDDSMDARQQSRRVEIFIL